MLREFLNEATGKSDREGTNRKWVQGLITYLTHQGVTGGRSALDVNLQRAAEQRSELSPR